MRCAILVAAIALFVAWLMHAGLSLHSYPDRLAQISSADTVIDNTGPYATKADWSPTGKMAMLHKVTPVRAEFFDAELVRLREQSESSSKPLRVLDAGCGGGLISNSLARRGHNITGIDISVGALDYARDTARAEGLENARFEMGSLYELPYASHSFDAVVCSDVLEHITDLKSVLRELRRVLRPGGLLLVDTINRTWLSLLVAVFGAEVVLGACVPGSHDWRLFITPEELTEAMEASGFRVRRNFPGFRPSLTMVLDALRAYVFHAIPVEDIRGEVSLEASPGWVNYFAVAETGS
mmetsp:Transcript_21408/g.47455  ORF Transcript_21408/g.47455 Transcript_21408/m.47455 type:complete len:296 (+) Transcript_21408:84-971(+)|eukprot:CAMPEP_0170610138 /NCGR_PEP_ID=MMETSP0224-20130122/22494_1 /TAXON_ID=285029 /ORGANISM="Togula jolla, Strain CCCM 725" /LENGTH=295 /DNA_ID=CAMNT_0010935483 /DNA_START=69 /DNA_END=956 /DNA_ORIENTATION=-